MMDETALLKLLEKHADMNTCDLASALNETQENILSKLNELEQMALIEVSVMPEREYGYDRIAKLIYRYPEVDTMYLMSGKSEFIVTVYGKTMQEIANFVGSKLACIDKVTGTCTLFVLKQYKRSGIVFEAEEDSAERLLVTP